jgi:hypothetical protein
MKSKIIIVILAILFTSQMTASGQNKNSSTKQKIETKLTVQQRVNIMTRELNLTTQEQTEVFNVLNETQLNKEKIKAQNLKKKEEKATINKIKDVQKTKLKKILGAKRFIKYQKLKKEDVF